MVTFADVPGERRQFWQIHAAPLAVITMLFVAVAARVLTFELRADEQLYIAPASLLGDRALYADFFYNHPPLSALFYRAVYLATGSQDLIGAARLGVILAWAATLVVVWQFSLAISRSVLVALFCTLAIEVNVYLLTVVGMTATNNFLQLGPVYAGLALFALATLEQRHRTFRMFAAGVILALGVGVKVSVGYAIVPLVLLTFLVPRDLSMATRIRTMTGPLALGGLIGALPLLYFLVQDPARLLDHLVGYHTGPHIAYWTEMRHTEPDLAFGLAERFRLAFEVWFQSTNLLILAAIAMLGSLALAARPWNLWPSVLAVGGITMTVAMLCFLPKPAFSQYFILPLAGMVLLPALLWRGLDSEQKRAGGAALAGLAVLMVVTGFPRLAESTGRLALGGKTTAQHVEAGGAAIRNALPNGATGKIATLHPLYPLEADLQVYDEFATGYFAYRVAPMADQDDLENYVMTGPSGVAGILDADRPAAILTGFAPDLEKPLEDWARANGYRLDPSVHFNSRYGSSRLWLPTD